MSRRTASPVIAANVTVSAAWAVLYLKRRAAHQPNVDDYLYVGLSRHLYDSILQGPGAGIHAFLSTGQTAPLVPFLAAPLTRIGGVEAAVAVELPLLLLLLLGAYLLARRWTTANQAAVIACLVALTEGAVGWSQMLNFTVAASAFSLLTLAAYLQSDGFRRWGWSIAAGVSVAALALSRSLAPAYVVPLALVVVVHLAIRFPDRTTRFDGWKLVAAVGLAVLLAAPWWVESGRTAGRYLLNAGYDASSGFASSRPAPFKLLYDRAQWTLFDLGEVERLALLAFAMAAATVVAHRRRVSADALLVGGWVLVTFAVLATSTNGGTGFGLPILLTTMVLIGAGLTRMPTRFALASASVAAVIVVVGVGAEINGSWRPAFNGPIYRAMVVTSGAYPGTDVDAVQARVARVIGDAPAVLVGDDDTVNATGLANKLGARDHVAVPSYGPDGTRDAIADLAGAKYLIGGVTSGPYHSLLNQAVVDRAASREGFRPVLRWQLGRRNIVEVWRRSSKTPKAGG